MLAVSHAIKLSSPSHHHTTSYHTPTRWRRKGTLKMRDRKMRDWKIREQEMYGTPRVAKPSFLYSVCTVITYRPKHKHMLHIWQRTKSAVLNISVCSKPLSRFQEWCGLAMHVLTYNGQRTKPARKSLTKTGTSPLNGPIMRQNRGILNISCTLKTTSGFIFLLPVV